MQTWRSVCLFSAQQPPPPVDKGLLIHEVSISHTTTHDSGRTPLDEWSAPSQRLLPDNTRQSQQTNIHAPGGIRTHNLSRRAAADLRRRSRGHWDRQDPTFKRSVSGRCKLLQLYGDSGSMEHCLDDTDRGKTMSLAKKPVTVPTFWTTKHTRTGIEPRPPLWEAGD